jgi:hypothetical protein
MWRLLILLALIGCAKPPRSSPPVVAARPAVSPAQPATIPEVPLTPEDRRYMSYINERIRQERELLQRALTNSPDYTAAVRRAAEYAITADPLMMAALRREPHKKAEVVAREEGMISNRIEAQRREVLANQQALDMAQRLQMAVTQCEMRGAQVEASSAQPWRLIDVQSVLLGANAREQCLRGLGL